MKGPTFNGNAFAENALSKGAVYAVIDEAIYEKDSRFILVDDALKALQNLANYYRHQCEIPFLAITGSNGKTTTKELVSRVLLQKYNTLATNGNLNNHIGVPLTLLSAKAETEFAVIEMGANHQKEIESYCNIAEPDFGLITNVGKAHLEGFGGFEGVKKGKGELYEWIADNGEAIFLNSDNAHLVSMVENFKIHKVITYGTKDNVYCKGKLIKEQPFLSVYWTCGEKSGTINSSIVGTYNFENILSAVCIGNYFGIDGDKICLAIESYQPDNSRSQLVKRGSNTIILDAYNANPTSMEAAINNFKKRLEPHVANSAQAILKDPYHFDFLGLGAEAHERDIENALIRHITHFLLELGQGFAFVGRQFRLEVEGDEFFIDLLFYHTRLRF